jgi:hypothetical protein
MKFSEEFRKQGRILAWDGDNVKATKFFGGADLGPSHFALHTRARLISIQKKARLLLSKASTTPTESKPMPMAWESMEDRTNLIRIRRLPIRRERPRHPESFISHSEIMGAKSEK